MLDWFFRGFANEASALTRYIQPLPQRPAYLLPISGMNYFPEWDIRVNVAHILGDLESVARLPVETGSFSRKAPDEYVVITPLVERFALFADDAPGMNIEEYRLSFFCKGNYNVKKWQLVRALLAAGFTITDRRYLLPDDLYEEDSGYHHYAIDVAKAYEWEEE